MDQSVLLVMILKLEQQKPSTLDWNKGCAVFPQRSGLRIVRKTQKALVLRKETDLYFAVIILILIKSPYSQYYFSHFTNA